VLDLCVNAGRDVGEAFAGNAIARRADAREIILRWVDVAAPSVAAPVFQEIGFDRHLEEGVIPTHMPAFSVALVEIGDVAVAGVEVWIALGEEGHQALRRDARRNLICRARSDRRRRLGRRRQRSSEHRCEQRRGEEAGMAD
jgi:hypothetical protein